MTAAPTAAARLCDGYAARDPRVTVIHKEDGGVSSARNAGLAACDAEYVVFLDSDDALRPGALQAALDAQAADPGAFVLWRYTDRPGRTRPPPAPAPPPAPPAALARLWLDCLIAMPWNKLYRGELARQLRFNESVYARRRFAVRTGLHCPAGPPAAGFPLHGGAKPADLLRLQPGGRHPVHPVPPRDLRDLAGTLCQAERRGFGRRCGPKPTCGRCTGPNCGCLPRGRRIFCAGTRPPPPRTPPPGRRRAAPAPGWPTCWAGCAPGGATAPTTCRCAGAACGCCGGWPRPARTGSPLYGKLDWAGYYLLGGRWLRSSVRTSALHPGSGTGTGPPRPPPGARRGLFF